MRLNKDNLKLKIESVSLRINKIWLYWNVSELLMCQRLKFSGRLLDVPDSVKQFF